MYSDDNNGRTYSNGDYYDFATGTYYYADGSTEYYEYAPETAMTSAAAAGSGAPNDMIVSQVVDQANSGWNVKDITNGLLQIGMTAAQIATLYNNVKSSQQLTPVALQNLQGERQYLLQQSQSQNTMWLWAAIGLGALVILSRRN